MDIKMFQMGFGESILLHEGDSCLLVDCGSESKYKDDYFDNVARELEKYSKRSLLISHFHEDHMNGIEYLYDHCSPFFDMVYLPNVFEDGDTALEAIIIQYLDDLASKKSDLYPIWLLLRDLIHTQSQIQLIQRGVTFDGPACKFKALWPIRDEKTITIFLRNVHMSSGFIDSLMKDVAFVANKMRNVVHLMIAPDDITSKYSEAEREFSVLEESVTHLRRNFTKLMSEAEAEGRKKEINKLFKKIKKNDHSIVFQTFDDNQTQILMTGDITSRSMSKIAGNRITKRIPLSPSILLKEHYEVVKTPHHGIKYRTKAGFLDIIAPRDVNRLLISNGETEKPENRRGEISEQYLSNSFVTHVYCTNVIRGRCEYMKNNNQCAAVCVDCKAGGVQVDCIMSQTPVSAFGLDRWFTKSREDKLK